jgi:hypothetical protein
MIKLPGFYVCLKCGTTYDDVTSDGTSDGLYRLKTSHDVKQDAEHERKDDDGDAG